MYFIRLQRLFIISVISLIFPIITQAQLSEGFKAEIELQAIGTTNKVVPFWMRSNQYGSVPLSGASGSILGRIYKDYKSSAVYNNEHMSDWGFGIEGRANGGNHAKLTLLEAYLKGRLGIFQLKAGRSKDVMGLNGDTTLSSGNFAISGNALGIPKIELSIPNYYRIPLLAGLFSVKGNIAHGWLGKNRILNSINNTDGSIVYRIENIYPKTYFHQKSLYVRLGKEPWKLKFYGGFNHQVFWGNEDKIYQGNYKLSSLESFFYVALGKTYGAVGVPSSKIGNQLGSIDVAAEYEFDNFKLMAYRQTFYDVGALSKLANIADGLSGLAIKNNKFSFSKDNFKWKSILMELFYSKNQAGYPWSVPTKSGDEDYYNNFFYKNGWSYNEVGLGNPLITSKVDARAGQQSISNDYFINNRVMAIHGGIEGRIHMWDFITKITYSENFGTFGTSIYGNSTGSIRNPQTENIFKKVNQFSFYLEASKEMKNNLNFGLSVATDQGRLLNNSVGMSVRLIKSFE
jgi:hypothetical protein